MLSARLLQNIRVNHFFRRFSVAPVMKPKKQKDYYGAIEALNSLQSNAQYIKNATVESKRTENIVEVTKFLERTGVTIEKLDELSVIHVTGTNGKGTTCAYCESILRRHGYKTGFYSSPHLLDVRERIRIGGKPISKNEFAKYFWQIYELLDRQKTDASDMPLYFRYLTILAFHIFLENKVDVAILEVGIGGEYDCTNVVRNTVVAGITPLDLDHTNLLGPTIESIAWNKSGIMKEGSVVFTGKQPEPALKVLVSRSLERKCLFNVLENNHYKYGNISKIPQHVQKSNASLALAICEAYIKKDSKKKNGSEFSLEIAKKAIENTCWPGRYEIKQLRNIRFFLDGAHTIESITVCSEWFLSKTHLRKKRALIFNVTGERNSEKFFKILEKCCFNTVIFTPNIGSDKDSADTADLILTTSKQLENCEEFKEIWLNMEKTQLNEAAIHVVSSFSKAVDVLDNKNEYDVLVTGSIHLIGSALSVLDPTLNGLLED